MSSVSEHLSGIKLPGKRVVGEWHVLERMHVTADDYQGQFSVGYRVKHDNGTEAFLKASDCGLLAQDSDDLAARATAGMLSYLAEVQILEYCHGNNMDRIVSPIDFGEQMHEFRGAREPLFWIVFELANGDARQQIKRSTSLDFAWALHAMHNLSVAVKQLHTAKVTHNDIKPSNLLVFDELLQKLGDLGSATANEIPTANDALPCAGDPSFAPPETLYASDQPRPGFNAKRAAELYMLGSVGVFLLRAPMTTTSILSRLSKEHRPLFNGTGWTGTLNGVLPYWQEAFSQMLIDLEPHLPHDRTGAPTNAAREYLQAISQLCHPDPVRRGHPINMDGNVDQYSVERFVSLFDRLRRQAVMDSRATQ